MGPGALGVRTVSMALIITHPYPTILQARHPMDLWLPVGRARVWGSNLLRDLHPGSVTAGDREAHHCIS